MGQEGVELAARPECVTLRSVAEVVVNEPDDVVVAELVAVQRHAGRAQHTQRFLRAAAPKGRASLQEVQVLVLDHVRGHLAGIGVWLALAIERLHVDAVIQDGPGLLHELALEHAVGALDLRRVRILVRGIFVPIAEVLHEPGRQRPVLRRHHWLAPHSAQHLVRQCGGVRVADHVTRSARAGRASQPDRARQ